LVKSMTADAQPHATAPAIHFIESYSEWYWNNFDIPTPISAEMPWPSRALRGWPSGERIELYSRTAEAP
jgi:hypothetical protein